MMWVLCGLLACQDPIEQVLVDDPDARRVVWAFVSADRETWVRQPEPVAYNMASLGLSVEADGSLFVTGIVEIDPPPWEWYLGPPIRGLRFDGEQWSAVRVPGGDPQANAYLDPQPFEGSFWYIAPESSDGDPALITDTPTPVRSFPNPQTHFADPGIADPAPIRMPDGSLHVFVTHNFNILHLTGEPLRERIHVLGANVPFPMMIDGRLHLLAQAALGRYREPVLVEYDLTALEDEQIEPDWQPVFTREEQEGLENCTSPVMAPSPAPEGGWILLCVEERIDCTAPDNLERHDHCRGASDAPPPPETGNNTVDVLAPGEKGPPQPVDCDYPNAAEVDPRCRTAAPCSTPELRASNPSCRPGAAP